MLRYRDLRRFGSVPHAGFGPAPSSPRRSSRRQLWSLRCRFDGPLLKAWASSGSLCCWRPQSQPAVDRQKTLLLTQPVYVLLRTTGVENIRDVIPYPRFNTSFDLLLILSVRLLACAGGFTFDLAASGSCWHKFWKDISSKLSYRSISQYVLTPLKENYINIH